jgi:hypothetical protein
MLRTNRSLVARAIAFLAIAAGVSVSTTGAPPAASAATLPSVSVSDVSVIESNGTTTAVFTITQDKGGKSTIRFATADDTATNPSDYVARTGSVRFAGKKLTRTVSVTVIGDTLDEPDETFLLELTGAKGATIADGEGVGTIMDDDLPPAASVDPTLSVPEGQTGDTSYASIHVTLSAASGRQVSVDWTTADGTATAAGNDYTPDSGTVDFAPGQTDKVLVIAVVGDDATEGDETFDVDLSSPSNATLGTATEVVTIVDNDPIPPGVPVLSVSDAEKREGASGTTTLTFTVTRGGETTTAVNVDYATSDGTALATSDYTGPVSGTLSFLSGDTTGTVDVTLNGDLRLEHDETLFLSLSNPTAGGAISTGQATGTIVNDDTRTTVVVKVKPAKKLVAVHGLVSPARAGKHTVVRLFRRHNGVWVRIGGKRALLRGKTDVNGDGFTDSRYATAFKRAKRGSCKVVARYPGDARFSGSSRTKLFRC